MLPLVAVAKNLRQRDNIGETSTGNPIKVDVEDPPDGRIRDID
jgi:hypothetical protein